MTRIDAHHHFWNPARGDYGWMPADDPVLSRTYGPADLAPGLAAAVLLLRHAREPARLRPAIVLTLVCAIAHGLLLAGAFLQVLMLR